MHQMHQRQTSPDLTRLDPGICSVASSVLSRSAQVTPLTSPENSPSIKRRNEGSLSDSDCDALQLRQNWKIHSFFTPTGSHITEKVTKCRTLNQISEDSNVVSTEPQTSSCVERPEQKRKKRTKITKFEINAFAPTSM